VSRKPFDLNLSPSRPFSWEQAMITDVADVKPTVTGMEMKSTKTPEKGSEENRIYRHGKQEQKYEL
jgi:hypothetical protein